MNQNLDLTLMYISRSSSVNSVSIAYFTKCVTVPDYARVSRDMTLIIGMGSDNEKSGSKQFYQERTALDEWFPKRKEESIPFSFFYFLFGRLSICVFNRNDRLSKNIGRCEIR